MTQTIKIPGHLNLVTAREWLANQKPSQVREIGKPNKFFGKLASLGLASSTLAFFAIMLKTQGRLEDVLVFCFGGAYFLISGITGIKELDKQAKDKKLGLSRKLNKALEENPAEKHLLKSIHGMLRTARKKGINI